MSRKHISYSTQRKLFLKSGNACCFPECKSSLYDTKTGTYTGITCHIHAVSAGGARFGATLSEQDVNEEWNLLLMCPAHHTIIDRDETTYNAILLKEYKRIHEERFERFAWDGAETIISSEDIDQIKELTKIINKLYGSQLELPKKNKYEKVKNYIERTLYPVVPDDENSESIPLLEIIKKHDKITILGIAGAGKSGELQHLANYFSSEESASLNSPKIRCKPKPGLDFRLSTRSRIKKKRSTYFRINYFRVN